MPCNGVAVATGIINRNLTELVLELPQEQLRAVLGQALTKQFPALTGKAIEALPYRYDLGVTDFGFKIGRFLFGIEKYGRVDVSVTQRAGIDDNILTKQMSETLTNLVKAMGGAMLQQKAVEAIKASGAKIESQQRAKNGSLVLTVDI